MLRDKNGSIIAHLKFEDLTKVSSLANPEILAGAGAVMTQMALEQSMKEITDRLNKINGKVDDLLQDQKDQTLATLIGTARLIDETKTIRDKVGTVSDTTWSKVADCPHDLASAQAYALVKIQNLASNVAKETNAAKAADKMNNLSQDCAGWLSVIGTSIHAQDELSIIELDRVMSEKPESVARYREGINEARKARLLTIQKTLEQLDQSIRNSSKIYRGQKVIRPNAVSKVLTVMQGTSSKMSSFANAVGIEANSTQIEMAPRWTQAAGELLNSTALEIESNAKQLSGEVTEFGKNAVNAVGEGVGFMGDYVGQLGRSLKETQDKLAGKFAQNHSDDDANPDAPKAGLKLQLHDLLPKHEESKR